MTKIRSIKVHFNVHVLYKLNHFYFIKVHVGFFYPSSGEGRTSTKCLTQHDGAAYMVITDVVIIYLDFHSSKQALWLVDSWSLEQNSMWSLIKFKSVLTRIQLLCCCPHAEYNSTWTVHDFKNGAILSTCSCHQFDWQLRMKKLCCLCLFVFAIWLLKGKSKYITKHLMYGPAGN